MRWIGVKLALEINRSQRVSNLLLRNIFFISITLLASAAPFGKAQAQAKPLFNVEPGSEYSGSVWGGVEVGVGDTV